MARKRRRKEKGRRSTRLRSFYNSVRAPPKGFFLLTRSPAEGSSSLRLMIYWNQIERIFFNSRHDLVEKEALIDHRTSSAKRGAGSDLLLPKLDKKVSYKGEKTMVSLNNNGTAYIRDIREHVEARRECPHMLWSMVRIYMELGQDSDIALSGVEVHGQDLLAAAAHPFFSEGFHEETSQWSLSVARATPQIIIAFDLEESEEAIYESLSKVNNV